MYTDNIDFLQKTPERIVDSDTNNKNKHLR